MRTYKRKTERAKTPPEIMLQAARMVKLEHKSVRSVSKDFDIPLKSLARYCTKVTQEELEGKDGAPETKYGYKKHRQVSLLKNKIPINQYILRCCKLSSVLYNIV